MHKYRSQSTLVAGTNAVHGVGGVDGLGLDVEADVGGVDVRDDEGEASGESGGETGGT